MPESRHCSLLSCVNRFLQAEQVTRPYVLLVKGETVKIGMYWGNCASHMITLLLHEEVGLEKRIPEEQRTSDG